MKPTIDVALALVGGVRAAIFLALLVVVGVVALVTGVRLDLAKARIATLEEAAKNWREANQANVYTIDALSQRIDGMVEARRLQREAQQAAIMAGLEREARITKELGKTRQELQDAYRRSPTAHAWGNAGVDADVARRLPGLPD